MIWQNLLNGTSPLKNFSHVHLGQRDLYVQYFCKFDFSPLPCHQLCPWQAVLAGRGQGDGEPRGRSCVCSRCVLGFPVTVPAVLQVLLQGIWNNSLLQVHCSHSPVSIWQSLLPCALTTSYFHLLLFYPWRLDCSDIFFFFLLYQ